MVDFSLEGLFSSLEQMGFFFYVVPFLIIFSLVYAVIDKSGFLGGNKAVKFILSAGVGLLGLWGGMVFDFFKIIFPRAGVGLGLLLVIVIFIGFFVDSSQATKLKWIGGVVAIGVGVWVATAWGVFGGSNPYGFWAVIEDVFPILLILGVVIWAIVAVVGPDRNKDKKEKGGP
jgi:hypothetical protein